MVVQHNITAMNANRMLGVTTTGQAKSKSYGKNGNARIKNEEA